MCVQCKYRPNERHDRYRSPDHADAIVVIVELCRTRLGAFAGSVQKQSDRWEVEAKKWDEFYDPSDIATSDPVEEMQVLE